MEGGIKAGAEAEAMKRAADWLVPQGLLSLTFYTIEDHLSRGCTTHSELDIPTSIISQENELQTCL